VTLFSQTQASITITGPTGGLQASASGGSADGELSDSDYICVVCHPHPQHGGSMDNKVVTTLARTYRDLGVPCVRFNFRGVGQSEGSYDHAVGEVEDLLAVLDWARAEAPQARLLLAGFSFGSAIAAAATHRSAWAPEQLTLVAPPVERYAYDRDGQFPCPVCVAQGGKDDVVVPEGVFKWCEQQLESQCELLHYPEAGHFFHGGLTQLKQDLLAVIPRQLAGAGGKV